MGDIETPGRRRTIEWLLAESACREILHSKIDSTDLRGGEDLSTIGRVFTEDIEYTFAPRVAAPGGGKTIVGRDALVAFYNSPEGLELLESKKFVHLLTNIQFTLMNPLSARSRALFATYAMGAEDATDRMIPRSIHEVNDEFRLCDDDVWRLSRRVMFEIGRRD